MTGRRHRSAFTLVELVVTMVIVGLLASMAVPRLSQGSGAATEASLQHDLMIVRNAINRYAAEHQNLFPPAASNTDFRKQMLHYSSISGSTRANRNPGHRFGPYLMEIPACPVGPYAGSKRVHIDAANSPPEANGSINAGWLYNPNTGEFFANDNTVKQYGITLPGVNFDGLSEGLVNQTQDLGENLGVGG